MSTTYCDPNCRFCTYNEAADRWELTLALPVRDDHDPPTLTEDGVLATLVHPATEIVACPNCGMGLREGGETEEMVSRKVAVSALEVCGRRCLDCDAHYHCPQLESDHGPYDVTLRQCAERRLAWAEQESRQQAQTRTAGAAYEEKHPAPRAGVKGPRYT